MAKMLINGDGHHSPPGFLEIKQEDKFFSRLLSKDEASFKGESSFRVMYYGGAAGAIPFTWESQPGTPKHKFSDTSLPPLTPPPSYKCTSNTNYMGNHTKSQLFHLIFPKLVSKKTKNMSLTHSSSSMSSSFSISSSKSSPSTPMNIPFISPRSRAEPGPRSRSAIYFSLDEDDNMQPTSATSPTSTLCFGARIESHRKKSRGRNLKKAFWSIVGYGMH